MRAAESDIQMNDQTPKVEQEKRGGKNDNTRLTLLLYYCMHGFECALPKVGKKMRELCICLILYVSLILLPLAMAHTLIFHCTFSLLFVFLFNTNTRTIFKLT